MQHGLADDDTESRQTRSQLVLRDAVVWRPKHFERCCSDKPSAMVNHKRGHPSQRTFSILVLRPFRAFDDFLQDECYHFILRHPEATQGTQC